MQMGIIKMLFIPPPLFLFLAINSNFLFTYTRIEAKVVERELFIFGEI